MKKSKKILFFIVLFLLALSVLAFSRLPDLPITETDRYFLRTRLEYNLRKAPSFFGDGLGIFQGKVFSLYRKDTEELLLQKGWTRGFDPERLFVFEKNKEKEKVIDTVREYPQDEVLSYFLNRSPYGEDDDHTGNWTYYIYHVPSGTLTRILLDT